MVAQVHTVFILSVELNWTSPLLSAGRHATPRVVVVSLFFFPRLPVPPQEI